MSAFGRTYFIKIYNWFRPSRSADESKRLWASLAAAGIGVSPRPMTHEETREWGREQYDERVKNDPLVPRAGAALDLGCGVGRLTEFLLESFNPVYGTDISGEFIEQAKQHVPGAIFFETDGQSIPLPDESINFVLSNAVFQHMPSRAVIEKNLKEIKRCLKRGGRAKMNFRGTPVMKSKWFYGLSFEEGELKDLLETCGFKILALRTDKREVGGKINYWAVIEK